MPSGDQSSQDSLVTQELKSLDWLFSLFNGGRDFWCRLGMSSTYIIAFVIFGSVLSALVEGNGLSM
jgi:hypothetical protein